MWRNPFIIPVLVTIERRSHLFPSRTQKLSFSSSKILDWRRSGKIEHCQCTYENTRKGVFFMPFCNVLSVPLKNGTQASACFPESGNNGLRFAKISLHRAKFLTLALKNIASAPMKHPKGSFFYAFLKFGVFRLV